jgi:hypothetical protein
MMGLFDVFKKKSNVENVTASPESDQHSEATTTKAKTAYFGDLEKTRAISQLVQTEYEERDVTWQQDFLSVVAQASFKCGDPQVISGPDGFPYVQLFVPEANQQFQCYVIENMKDDFLLNLGYGVVINPVGGQPDWVFTYGDIVNLHVNKVFYTHEATAFSKNVQDEVIQDKEEVFVGQPSEYILPLATRQVLNQFLQAQGVSKPKIALMQRKNKNGDDISQDLVFNITPENFGNEEEYRVVMQHLGWFLPRHYSFAGMSERSLSEFMVL